jgi:hypothetical protein
MSESESVTVSSTSSPRKRRKPFSLKNLPRPQVLELQMLPVPTPTPSPVALVPVPKMARTRRPRSPWQPNHRKWSILKIDSKLSPRKYAVELDKLESIPDKWKDLEKQGIQTHEDMWNAKGTPYRGWLRDERRATWKAWHDHYGQATPTPPK